MHEHRNPGIGWSVLTNEETTVPRKSSVFAALQLNREREVSQTAGQEEKPGYQIQHSKAV